MISYLTGADNAEVRAIAKIRGIGLLIQPGTKQYAKRIAAYPTFAIDNGCFAAKTYVGDAAYLAWLDTLPRTALFATAPDVVGDAAATIERSAPMLSKIRALGFAVAFVAQDGLEDLETPWDSFDVLFIGGSTEWKLSPAAKQLTDEAHRRGKRVHMGRVNSGKRLRLADLWRCETADGTFLAFGPSANLPRLTSWLEDLELMPRNWMAA